MKLYEFFNVPVDNKAKKFPNYPGEDQEEKEKMADEVFWYIIDNDALHKEYSLPFLRDVKSQVNSPNFNKTRFAKQWVPMVKKGCHLFYKHKKLKGDPKDIFDTEMIEDLCKRLGDKFFQEIQKTEYHIGDHKK